MHLAGNPSVPDQDIEPIERAPRVHVERTEQRSACTSSSHQPQANASCLATRTGEITQPSTDLADRYINARNAPMTSDRDPAPHRACPGEDHVRLRSVGTGSGESAIVNFHNEITPQLSRSRSGCVGLMCRIRSWRARRGRCEQSTEVSAPAGRALGISGRHIATACSSGSRIHRGTPDFLWFRG